MSKLQFKRTISIDQLKSELNIKELKVIRNPKSEKLFFEYMIDDNKSVGAVTITSSTESAMASWCTGGDDVGFWMIHNANDANVEFVL